MSTKIVGSTGTFINEKLQTEVWASSLLGTWHVEGASLSGRYILQSSVQIHD